MKRTSKYVALDVHQATTVTSVRVQSGRVVARSILPTEPSALVEYFGGMRGSIRVVFEEGTQAQWLHDLLAPIVAEVVVCDRRGDLRTVYHGRGDRRSLQELTRTYLNLVEDSTRTMLRLKSLFRARAIRVPGKRIYGTKERALWLARLPDRGARFRAETLYAELDVLRELRPKAKALMAIEARRDPAAAVLRSIPFVGPVRVALLLATMKTPWRFRTKRNLWAYAGLAVVTESSADHVFIAGHPVRRRRKPLTRGLNKNHNRVLKSVFKGLATASIGKPGPFQDLYRGMLDRGMREDMARVTLARKFAALTLRLWKTGESYDPTKLTMRVT